VAYDLGLNLQEESITECLLLQMARDLPDINFRVRLFTRQREAETGADWVWFFKYRHCRIGFRVQAKKLYKRFGTKNVLLDGRYDSILKKRSQPSDLISRAGPNNPIYVFFNHSEVADAHLFSVTSSSFRTPSFWGCSFAPADFVMKTKSGMLHKLIGGMRPLHELFAAGRGCALANGLQGLNPTRPVLLHDNDPDWFKLQDEPSSMEQYLVSNDLKGIAFFDASEVKESLLVPR
jgi:hypothetical protein